MDLVLARAKEPYMLLRLRCKLAVCRSIEHSFLFKSSKGLSDSDTQTGALEVGTCAVPTQQAEALPAVVVQM